jgi:hypothetical protein
MVKFYNFTSGKTETAEPILESPPVNEGCYEPKVGDWIRFQKAWRGMYYIMSVSERMIELVEQGYDYPTRIQPQAFALYQPYPVSVKCGGHLVPVTIPEHVVWRIEGHA